MVPSSFVRWAGIASLAAAGLMLVHQISQLVFALTMSESMAIATHSLRNGLALVAMYALLIALTGLYAMQATAPAGSAWSDTWLLRSERCSSPVIGGTRPSSLP